MWGTTIWGIMIEETTPTLILTTQVDDNTRISHGASKQDKQFGKFLEILKQLHINISLVETLQQILNLINMRKGQFLVLPISTIFKKMICFVTPKSFIENECGKFCFDP